MLALARYCVLLQVHMEPVSQWRNIHGINGLVRISDARVRVLEICVAVLK